MNSIAAALAHTRRDTELDFTALNEYSDYWEVARSYYAPFDNAPNSGTGEVYLHEMPGGQYTNLKEQADAMGLAERWPEIARTYADVNRAFGDIVKVTPSSKVVGDMAIFLVTRGMTVAEFERLDENHTLTLPNSVIEMFQGALGIPKGGWPKKIQKIILKGAKPSHGRPGAQMKPVDFAETGEVLEKKIARKPSQDEILSYLMYPDVFLKFAKATNNYGDVDVIPTPQFFYGMKTGEEISVEIETGKTLVLKYLTTSEPRPDAHRTVFFELNGQPREAHVRDASIQAREAEKQKADPNEPGQVGAPTPGMVAAVAVELNQPVKKGDRLATLEAMKMQTTIYAPVDGRVTQKLAHPGQIVDAKELMFVIG
jgi:pyruvate carboxylase